MAIQYSDFDGRPGNRDNLRYRSSRAGPRNKVNCSLFCRHFRRGNWNPSTGGIHIIIVSKLFVPTTQIGAMNWSRLLRVLVVIALWAYFANMILVSYKEVHKDIGTLFKRVNSETVKARNLPFIHWKLFIRGAEKLFKLTIMSLD